MAISRSPYGTGNSEPPQVSQTGALTSTPSLIRSRSVSTLDPLQVSGGPTSSGLFSSLQAGPGPNVSGLPSLGGAHPFPSSSVPSPATPPSYNYTDIRNYKSVLLENTSSVARDHMANERTFLAWLRTSLAFVSIGIGVTQLFRLASAPSSNGLAIAHLLKLASLNAGKILGTLFIALGILCLGFGLVRYFEVQALLQQNYYPASRLGVVALLATVFVLITATFITVILAT